MVEWRKAIIGNVAAARPSTAPASWARRFRKSEWSEKATDHRLQHVRMATCTPKYLIRTPLPLLPQEHRTPPLVVAHRHVMKEGSRNICILDSSSNGRLFWVEMLGSNLGAAVSSVRALLNQEWLSRATSICVAGSLDGRPRRVHSSTGKVKIQITAQHTRVYRALPV